MKIWWLSAIAIHSLCFAQTLEVYPKILASPCGVPVTSIDLSYRLDEMLYMSTKDQITDEHKYTFYSSNWEQALLDLVVTEALSAKADTSFHSMLSANDINTKVLDIKASMPHLPNNKLTDIAIKEIALEILLAEQIYSPASLYIRPEDIRNAYVEYVKECEHKGVFSYVIISFKPVINYLDIYKTFYSCKGIEEFQIECRQKFLNDVSISKEHTNELANIRQPFNDTIKLTPIGSLSSVISNNDGERKVILVTHREIKEPVSFKDAYQGLEHLLTKKEMAHIFENLQKELVRDLKIRSSICKHKDKTFAMV